MFVVFFYFLGDIWFVIIEVMLMFFLKFYECKMILLLFFFEWFFMEIYLFLVLKFYCRGFYVYLDMYIYYVNFNYNKWLYNGFFFLNEKSSS